MNESLVRVDPLVRDRTDLVGVLEDAGDECLAGLGELHRIVRIVEGVGIALEQAHVGVHRGAGLIAERLGHEARPNAFTDRDLLHDVPERHDVVGHREGVGVAQIDLLLTRRGLVVAELDRDAHRLECVDGVAAEIRSRIVHSLVEVSARVRRDRWSAVDRAVLQKEELDFRVDVAAEAQVAGLAQLATQYVARIGPRRRTVGHRDVTEHASGMLRTVLVGPRQDLECRGVGPSDGVGFGDSRESLDGGTVESDSLLEGAFEFGGGDRHRFEVPENIGEPQADKPNVALFQGTKHEFFLAIHARETKQATLNLCYISGPG